MNEYVKLSVKEFSLNPLHYVSLPGYSFDCLLKSSGVTLDTLQDKQMLDDFVEAKRGVICRIMGDRYININNSNRSIWYIDANNLYGYVMMQKLLNKDIEYTTTMAEHEQRSISLYTILNTPDDGDQKKINDNELGYRERDGGKARSEKLILDQKNKLEYMVHYRMLKFYVKMGVKVTKIHIVIKFKQVYICRLYSKQY